MVTDVGSTKRGVVGANGDERFVGGHPLAGSEAAGVAHARDDLFDGAVWYLTPTSTTSGIVLERLHRFVSGLGARPAAIDADTHDRMMAAVSHLPHVVANVLVAQAARALGGERLPPTGPSFRDATRVAGANPALWPDIYLANRDALLHAIDDTLARLQAARAALSAGDRATLARWQAEAASEREALLEAGRHRRHRRASCAPSSPTGPASSPTSPSPSAARASTSPTWRSRRPPTSPAARSRSGSGRTRRPAPRSSCPTSASP